jgi:2,3-bisphosphoglycerate-independent phosphoglycerate mutase
LSSPTMHAGDGLSYAAKEIPMPSSDPYPLSRAVKAAYLHGKEDETLEPQVLMTQEGIPAGRIRRGDAVIFYNIRGEREIELTESLTDPAFDKFPAEKNLPGAFATMIEYRKGLNVRVAFPQEDVIGETLCDVLAAHGVKQVKITEAEKAVHVGFFLNGKKQESLPGEERIVVPTRKDVALFDEAPEMSIEAIADAVIAKIHDPECGFIFANLPNVDVVGHIENKGAVIRAVEAVDRQAGRIVAEAEKAGLTAIVTADHGTAERWLFPDGAVDTGHTDSPVPFILIHPRYAVTLRSSGELTDVAPTVLHLLGLPKPAAMTGTSLIDTSGPELTVSRILVLLLDGWGINEAAEGNLIAEAGTPNFDRFYQTYPAAKLAASGEAVGLPPGTVGNSEAGHLHIGAGRRIYSDRVQIDRAIADGSFFRNEAFLYAMNEAKRSEKALHLMGIVSFFSSHGSIRHLFALMDMAKREGVKELFIHAMLGRRGEQPESGAIYIREIEKKCAEMKLGRVVSVIGRYWSMDREENWDRIEKTYRMLVCGDGVPVAEDS